MTNSDNSVFKEYSDILSFYQSPSTGTSTQTTKNNNYIHRCLNCNREIVDKNNLSAYCSTSCMNERDKRIDKKTDHKQDSNNIMKNFSEIIRQ